MVNIVLALIHRTQWKKCTFSGDGDYICAGLSSGLIQFDCYGIDDYCFL